MLCDHKGKITVKIDSIAASAASVVAMAGDRVLMSPVAMLMIQTP
jgi:Clp protease.